MKTVDEKFFRNNKVIISVFLRFQRAARGLGWRTFHTNGDRFE